MKECLQLGEAAVYDEVCAGDSNPRKLEDGAQRPPLGGQFTFSAAQPPPAKIQMTTREASSTVPDSYSVGSSLPPGTPAALRPGRPPEPPKF